MLKIEWKRKIKGVSVMKQSAPVSFWSGGRDFSINQNGGRTYYTLYRIIARKGRKINANLFLPNYPVRKAVEMTMQPLMGKVA